MLVSTLSTSLGLRNHYLGSTFARSTTEALADHVQIIGELHNTRENLVSTTIHQRPLQSVGVSKEELDDQLNTHMTSAAVGFTPRVAYSQSIGSVPHYAGFIPQERNLIGQTFGQTSTQATRQLRQGTIGRSPTRPFATSLSPTFKGDLIGYDTARRLENTH